MKTLISGCVLELFVTSNPYTRPLIPGSFLNLTLNGQHSLSFEMTFLMSTERSISVAVFIDGEMGPA